MADKSQWYLETLEFLRSIVALPTLASLITLSYTDDKVTIAVTTGIALAIALGLRLFGRIPGNGIGSDKMAIRRVFFTTLPWLLTAVVVFILAFFVMPLHMREEHNLLANAWLQWQKSLEHSARKCSNSSQKFSACMDDEKCRQNKERVKALLDSDSACLADKLYPVLQKRPHLKHETDLTGLASDLLAGQLMLANDNTRAILNSRFSVGGRFVGDGLAEPSGEKDITTARAPEFLVPNLSDGSAQVWAWELDRAKMWGQLSMLDINLLTVLRRSPTINHADFKEKWNYIKRHLDATDSPRPLVRFGLLTHDQYSGCLGRPEASRVFMIGLREVAGKTVRDAAHSSGYTIPPKGDEPGLKLFVWIYAPAEASEEVPAIWGNVLDNFSSWSKDEPCRTEH